MQGCRTSRREPLPPDILLPARTAAYRLGRSMVQLRRMVKDGRLKARREGGLPSGLGSRLYYSSREIDRYIEALPDAMTPKKGTPPCPK